MEVKVPENIDIDNQEFQNAWNLIMHTHQSVFLTGKAGTGKSTFLKYICANTRKKYVVLAPTGIAAVNVGGVTMHSFFKMPLKPLLPDDPDYTPRRIRQTLRFSREKVKLLKELDLIIIDEISMVRADMIDFMDRVLKIYSENMREPFGGKQMLFVGDIFQLEPVVTADMRSILKRYYNQCFFFNAHVFGLMKLVPIELRKIYRQTDVDFVSMLDRVRVNHATKQDIAMINSRYNPNYESEDGKFVMTLATRRDTVDVINENHMNAINKPEFVFEGEVEGTFPSQSLPTLKELVIKEGAQVIFIRNDKEGRWINGTLGRVCWVDENGMRVELENGNIYDVEPDIWENMQYSYDEEKKVVVENVLGSFKQFPVKPAWALTVHKSQGLTFNNIVVDFAGGAFSSGQTYVALSRCTSLEGIVLLGRIDERDIIVNSSVVEFSRKFNDNLLINEALNKAKAADLYNKAVKAFDANRFGEAIEMLVQAMAINNVSDDALMRRFAAVKLSKFAKLNSKIDSLTHVIAEQNKTLRDLAIEYVQLGRAAVDMNVDDMKCAVKDVVAVKGAIANFNKALRLHSACVDAMTSKAKLLAALGEYEKADELLRTVREIDGLCYEALIAHGYVMLQLKDIPGTIKSYKLAIKSNHNAPEPHELLAGVYDSIGLDEDADKERAKAVKLRAKLSKNRSNNKR
ncbi:MAG: AAA family ATPase [Muribaculaceae bacterium]